MNWHLPLKINILTAKVRHYENYFDSTQNELEAFSDLLYKMKTYTDEKYKPVAYNVSVNAGKKAGQVIMHAHIHLIPRY
jgi:histidine triad (HIT) family protein